MNAPQPSNVEGTRSTFSARNYDLDATLTSGQAFRWRRQEQSWVGVIGKHWVRLRHEHNVLAAETAEPVRDWDWLTSYLQLDVDLDAILRTFPKEEPMQAAAAACRGLRLLRQEPWECLASFILSSTKQIVQIQQVVASVCESYGERVKAPEGYGPAYAFPSPARLAGVGEARLRACKMGFRAPYLLAAGRAVASGQLNLAAVGHLTLAQAREQLMELPGVGRKIADCVLLFAYGFASAFPVDVWVIKALRELYFHRRRATLKQLQRFTEEHFGPYAGYAQQYLFHYMRTQMSVKRAVAKGGARPSSGAARSASAKAPRLARTQGNSDVAAPEDGRTPPLL